MGGHTHFYARVLLAAVFAAAQQAQSGQAATDTQDEPVHPKIVRWVRKHKKVLDWRKLLGGAEKVIFLGDIHQSEAIVAELADHAEEIAAAGITHMGLEPFGDDQQSWLDQYREDATGWERINAHLMSTCCPRSEATRRLFDSARRVGLTLVAIDMPFSIKKASKLGQLPPDMEDGVDMNYYLNREERMVRTIGRVVASRPDARMLAFVGSGHAVSHAEPQMVREKGLSAKTYMFANQGNTIDRAVVAAGLAEERIVLPSPPGSDSYDGYILTPEIRRQTSR